MRYGMNLLYNNNTFSHTYIYQPLFLFRFLNASHRFKLTILKAVYSMKSAFGFRLLYVSNTVKEKLVS